MMGVIAVAQSVPVGVAIEDLVLVAECSSSEEWRNQVRHIPLRCGSRSSFMRDTCS